MSSKLRQTFKNFSESAKPISKLMDDITANAPFALKSQITRDKHTAMGNASIVLLSGFLESFLRECAECFFEELHRRQLQYSELPFAMHAIHFVDGLEEVHRIARSDKKSALATFSNTRNALSKLLDPAAKGLSSLYWEAFAVTKGNPSVEVITDYLKKFGLENPIKLLANVSRQSEGLLRLQLTSFNKMRNECAHTGRVKISPQPSEVKEFVHMLRSIALGITKLLDRKIVEVFEGALLKRAAG